MRRPAPRSERLPHPNPLPLAGEGIPFFLVVAALVLASCKFSVVPNTAKFNCASDADCGSGYTCVTQKLTNTGICFVSSACGVETCNGLDDDCDGVIDDNIAAVGTPCPTTGTVCAVGVQACEGGALICVGQVLPQPERCDGITDLNCNGLVGCADPACVGTSACGPGCICRADGGAREADCGDGVDNNGNGLIDCGDPDCLNLACEADAGICAYTGLPVELRADGGRFHPSPRLFPDGGEGDAGPEQDAGSDLDAGPSLDAGVLDAGAPDAGPADAGAVVDAGLDAGPEDAGPTDAGVFCAVPGTP